MAPFRRRRKIRNFKPARLKFIGFKEDPLLYAGHTYETSLGVHNILLPEIISLRTYLRQRRKLFKQQFRRNFKQ